MSVQISGLDQIVSNLNKVVSKINGHSKEGLDSAAQFIMLEAVSRAPHDSGHLKDSAYHDPFSTAKGFGEIVGFDKNNTLGYATYIHEKEQKTKNVKRTRKGSRGHYWDQGMPHFLSVAMVENFTTVFNIIEKHAGAK